MVVVRLTENLFNSQVIKINDNVEFHYIGIKDFNKKFIDYINENFVSICKGEKNTSSLEIIKKRAFKFFEKKDERTRNGGTAEFFLHLYLKFLDYKQECMFLNMEEASIKKGFDGYYSKGNDEWILESKSGNYRFDSVSHHSKITEAYNSLKKQLNGESENDPWQNAYQHANSKDVDTNNTILKILQEFSDDFFSEIYYTPEDFNIIPAGTVFLNGEWEDFDVNEIYEKVVRNIKGFEYKKLIVICCTKKSLDLFMDFLGVPKREGDYEQQGKNAANTHK